VRPTALLTGVTGQDGTYLAERLVADGYEVHGVVRPSDPLLPQRRPLLEGVRLHELDLRDAVAVRELVVGLRPAELYHLAGQSSVARSWEQPLETAEVNGLSTLHLLEAVRAVVSSGAAVRFLLASSAEIFGEPAQVPQDEDTPVRPVSPYGAAKAFAHQVTAVYRGRGLHASAVILYNHESPRRPPHFVTRRITSGVAAIARGQRQRLELGNLDAARDWGWAPDYVDAMLRVVRHDVADDYVVATGERHTVREFAHAALDAAGLEPSDRYLAVDPALERPADAAVQVGDATRLRTRLGWRPTVDFAEIVRRMVAADLAGS
jgi:GDPmannose 4,6-dehydratase